MGVLKIIVTGAGAPGIKGTIFSLKNNPDSRKIHIVGTDIVETVVGKYLCDDFRVIPPASHTENYLNTMLRLCEELKVSVLIPQNTAELLLLSANKMLFEAIGTKVLVSNLESVQVANDKYKFLSLCKNLDISVPEFYLVNNFKDLKNYARILGWPKKKIVVKPPMSNGSRGVRIIDEDINLKESFFNEKPSSLLIKMTSLEEVLGENFPDLIVSEYLPGNEFTVDVLRFRNEIITIPRKRDLIRSGITFNGSLIKNDEIISQSEKISEGVDLEYCFGFQFKENYDGIPSLMECNPRIQGTMVLSTLAGANLIYGALKSILNEELPKFEIDWETKLLRYWGGIGISKNKIVEL